MNYNNIKGAIFDLDGTLLDSMWVWEDIDIKFLEKRNIIMTDDYHDAIKPLGFRGAAIYTINRFGFSETPEEIMKEWFDMAYERYKTAVTLKKNAKEYLLFLKNKGIRLGIATANDRELFIPALENNGISSLFDAMTSVSEVSKGKGFPDIYLKTAEKLGLDPSECIVLEDILAGIKGAKDGGFITVGVYDSRSFYEKDEIVKLADEYITDFAQLMPQLS